MPDAAARLRAPSSALLTVTAVVIGLAGLALAAAGAWLVVLGGKSCTNHPGLLQAAFEVVQRQADAAGMPAPDLRLARYGELAAAVGAAALALHEYLRPLQPDARTRRARAAREDRVPSN